MKTIGINIDGVVRDMYSQFDKHYRKVFIHNPSHVEMNTDMTVKENTEEDWDKLDKIKSLKEKELISLPMNSFELSNHYKFEEKVGLDGESVLSPEDALDEFMHQSYPFQVFGQAEEYAGACDTINRIQAYGLENDLFNVVLLSSVKSPAIPATFHFLAKNASRIRNVQFVEDDSDKWDHCDILIDCTPEIIQDVPEGKMAIKIEHPFNQWDDIKNSFKTLKEITPSFIENLIVGEKKS